MTKSHHYDDVTRTSCSPTSPVIRMFVQQFIWIHIKETSKSVLLALSEGNSSVTSDFPAQRASNAEKASMWWRHMTRLVLGLKHSLRTRQIPWPLMSRLLSWPGHQQDPFLTFARMIKCKHVFMFPPKKFSTKRFDYLTDEGVAKLSHHGLR